MQYILINVNASSAIRDLLHEGWGERQIQHEAKLSAVFALKPHSECNKSHMAREKAVHYCVNLVFKTS